MRQIAGSIVVFAACVVAAAGVVSSGDRAAMGAIGAGIALAVLGLVLAFSKEARPAD